MSRQGEDCYFFYYSTCTKGDRCRFRHCEEAAGSEIICSLWEKGCCNYTNCRFRHMRITKKRKEKSYYGENQGASHLKRHCDVFGESCDFDNLFVSPEKRPCVFEEAGRQRGRVAEKHGKKTASIADVKYEERAWRKKNAADDHNMRRTKKRKEKSHTGENQAASQLQKHCDVFGESPDFEDLFVSPEKRVYVFEEAARPRGSVVERPGRKKHSIDVKYEERPWRKRSVAEDNDMRKTQQKKRKEKSCHKENLMKDESQKTHCRSNDKPRDIEEAVRPRGSVAERHGRKKAGTDEKYEEDVRRKKSPAECLGREVDEDQPPQTAVENLGLTVRSVVTLPDKTTELKRKRKVKHIETICEDRQAFPFSSAEAHLSSTLWDSGCSPLREEFNSTLSPTIFNATASTSSADDFSVNMYDFKDEELELDIDLMDFLVGLTDK